ncbi:MAG: hypothetical protein JEY97_12065 [Bacteroidales bacterium]|nr:hypothetical protein [Bacteroidales bacterium]
MKILHGGQAYVSHKNMPEYKAAKLAYTEAFDKKPVHVRSGGNIPIISLIINVN